VLLNRVDAQSTRRPFDGNRCLVVYLTAQGHAVNRKRVQRLRRVLGLADLVAILDGSARRVLVWRLSNILEAGFCVDCLEDAWRVYGRPDIFNTDQGRNSPEGSPSAWMGRSGIGPHLRRVLLAQR
jgi:putative transposase